MKKAVIPFSASGHIPPLVRDYLSGQPGLNDFYELPPEPASFIKKIAARDAFPVDRKLLRETLLRQYGNIISAPVADNIELLANPGTYTVTTGHQLNLFTGPLFSIYKIASTIKLAQMLEKQAGGKKIVPVFWMASEDHDIDEIRSINIFGKTITWKTGATGAVGRMPANGIEHMLSSLKELFPDKNEDLIFFEKAYLDSQTITEATRKVMHHLFGNMGLVIIDGDDAELKRGFAEEMEKELMDGLSGKLVNEANFKLDKHYKLQVTPRDINLFYLTENKRERIVKENDDRFVVLNSNKSFTLDEIKKELNAHPERFSPNVVMRPLYQEKILPNIGYIGGPGEVSYWLQFRPMFKAFNISFPLLVLRDSFLLVDKNSYARMQKLGINGEELFEESEKLISKTVIPENFNFSAAGEAINKIYNELVADADPGLTAYIESEKQKALKGLASIEEKARRAYKKKNETVVNQVRNLKEKLFPGGNLQERHDNFIPFYLNSGIHFIEEIIEHSDPFSNQFKILYDDSTVYEKA